jgi:glycogen(starch) synthase
MRICIVTREYPPVTPYSGGVGTTFALLAPELARRGHELTVLAPALDGKRLVERDGVRLYLRPPPTPERLFFLEEPVWALAVDRELRRLGRFDVVFAAEWGGDASLYARHRRSGPLVVQLTSSIAQILAVSHGLQPSRRWRLKYALQAPMERAQTERADGILASTHAILNWARDLWQIDAVRSVVIPNVVDVDRVRTLARSEPPPGYPGDGPVVAFAGRLEPRKGPQVLVEAMRGVWAELPEARLVMLGADGDFGQGKMSARLRELADRHVDRLHLLGRQPPERLFPALAAAEVVALPSLWENFAAAGLEAMALGSAVVATTGGGFEEFIDTGRDGVLVPPGEPEPLARALAELLRDPTRRQSIGSAAAAKAEQFDVAALAPSYAAFFEEIAGAA